MSNENKQNGGRKYIVLDIVFYGGSLNYDQGTGNYQELKKITKWDGKQYILVSRYALRYSILHNTNWTLASGGENGVLTSEKGEVARLKTPEEAKKSSKEYFKEIFENYPEFDLFGFMIAPKGKNISITRTSPVKISHAISLTPYNYDSQFTANLDMMRRAAGPGAGSNPVNIEEKMDFYVYNVVIDVERIGKYTKEEHGNEEIGDIDVSNKRNERIIQLIEAILNLKREIKGRIEDLSPWLVICGLYRDGKYETYINKIELAKSHFYKVITKEKETIDSEGRKVKELEHEIIEKDAPKFVIDMTNIDIEKDDKDAMVTVEKKEEIIEKIKEFLEDKSNSPKILVYKRPFIQLDVLGIPRERK
ncbi:MAG: type I-B CRISPR-associated protein Cas7/Cst2/DevR [Candidatus Aenigmatarchaeota archaeon]